MNPIKKATEEAFKKACEIEDARVFSALDELLVVPSKKAEWGDNIGPVRVMVVCEGYVVSRRKGCAPMLLHVSDFVKRFKKICEVEHEIM